MDWQAFWSTYPGRSESVNLLGQVGKTVAGVPISAEQVEAILGDITAALDLGPSDRVLDLCCGNGLLTRALARRCHRVLGIDFSEPLLEQAASQCQAPNLEYRKLDARKLDALATESAGAFDKVLMYEALAYFSEKDVALILDHLRTLTRPGSRVLLGSVLDSARRGRFLNTWRRWLRYLWQVQVRGRDPGLGRWWSRHQLERLAGIAGYQCAIREQNPLLHTAHYRFDVLLTRIPMDRARAGKIR